MPKRGSRHYHGDNDEDGDGSLSGDSDEDGDGSLGSYSDGDSGDSDGASIKVAERSCPCSPPPAVKLFKGNCTKPP